MTLHVQIKQMRHEVMLCQLWSGLFLQFRCSSASFYPLSFYAKLGIHIQTPAPWLTHRHEVNIKLTFLCRTHEKTQNKCDITANAREKLFLFFASHQWLTCLGHAILFDLFPLTSTIKHCQQTTLLTSPCVHVCLSQPTSRTWPVVWSRAGV